jgi:4-hydroxy-2-oxoheptanedioate aldolase
MRVSGKLLAVGLVAAVAAFVGVVASAQQPAPVAGAKAPAPLYNTAKAKLLAGKQVFSFTQSTADPAGYCEKAKHYDYTWFEMQHSTLEFKDIEAMIAACPHSNATPMIRLPDAQEWHIQHTTDIGCLGVIVPTVDDVDRASQAAMWSRYPPEARRSSGAGQAASIWQHDYHNTVNDNMLVTLMIETPTGVANSYDIARVRGIDVVIIGNNDLSQFSGYKQGTPEYQSLMNKVHENVKKAGKIFGQASAQYAKGNPLSSDSWMFQNGPSNDGYVPPGRGGRGRGAVDVNAAPEGERP